MIHLELASSMLDRTFDHLSITLQEPVFSTQDKAMFGFVQ